MVFYVDIEELTDFGIDRDEDATIDVWSVPHRAGDAFFFDQDALGLAELGFVDLLGDLVDGGGEFAMPFLLGSVVEVVVHFVSAGAFFLGVLENAAAFEFETLDELEEFFVVLVSLAGEAGDKGGANREVGNAGAHAVKKIADIFSVGLAVHLVEHVIRDVLERDVDIAGNLGAFRDGLNEFVGPVRGVSVEQANPEVALEFVEGAQERCERFAA